MVTAVVAMSVFFGSMNPISGKTSLANKSTGDTPATKTISGLCIAPINNPDTESEKYWTAFSYVYYGKYYSKQKKNDIPIRYRVLTKDTTDYTGGKEDSEHTMLFDCDLILYASRFSDRDRKNRNDWEGSLAQSTLNGDKFYNKALSAPEQDAIPEAYQDKGKDMEIEGEDHSFKFVPLKGDKIFLLGMDDVSNESYGYANPKTTDLDRVKQYIHSTPDSELWYLRSKGVYKFVPEAQDAIGSVSKDGWPGAWNAVFQFGISPAFNVKHSSVLFTSQVFTTPAEYKLTLKDKDIEVQMKEGKELSKNGNTVTVPYTVSNTGKNKVNRISVLLLKDQYTPGTSVEEDSATATGMPKCTYLKLNTEINETGDGEGTFELPAAYADKTLGEDYHMYLVAESVAENDPATEDIDESLYTDYAGISSELLWSDATDSATAMNPQAGADATMIVLIVAGSVAVVFIVGVVIFYNSRKRRKKNSE